MVLKFFTVVFWICLLPVVLALMAVSHGLVIVCTLLYLIFAIGFFLAMLGASLVGAAVFGYVGVDMLSDLFTSDTVQDAWQLAAVPGSWWLHNFNQAWSDLQEDEEFSGRFSS